MANDAVTVSRSDLEKLRRALAKTIDTTVTIQGLCRLGQDDEVAVCLDAIEACIESQERLVLPAADLIAELLQGPHPRAKRTRQAAAQSANVPRMTAIQGQARGRQEAGGAAKHWPLGLTPIEDVRGTTPVEEVRAFWARFDMIAPVDVKLAAESERAAAETIRKLTLPGCPGDPGSDHV